MNGKSFEAPLRCAMSRPVCPRCLRPQAVCFCAWITPLASAIEILILQHPLEVGNAKNTARLLHLSLENSRLEVGETFAPDALAVLLAGKRNLLLYPDLSDAAAPNPAPNLMPMPASSSPDLRLVVLDATWRKSRKMLYLNPLLATLPRLALRDTPPSRYLMRKAHLPDQLSTLEATCYALAQLENDGARFTPLIAAFDTFVAQHLRFVPARPIR
jgi:DTW domain-containing protein YfiP